MKILGNTLLFVAVVFYAWMVMAYIFGRDTALQARKAYRWLAP